MSRHAWNVAALVIAVAVVFAGGPWLVRQMRSLPDASDLAARAEERIVTLEIFGLECDGCPEAVRDRLFTVAGVSAVDVRPAQARAYVVCAKDVPDFALVRAARGAAFAPRVKVVRK